MTRSPRRCIGKEPNLRAGFEREKPGLKKRHGSFGGPEEPCFSFFRRTGLGSRLAAAANRGAVEAHVASAAVLEAAGQGVAAGLQNVAAGFVAAGASDAAAILGQFALAVAAAEVDLATSDAVLRATHAAQARREGPAEVLQGGTRDIIIAGAVQLQPSFALFEADFAAGDDAPVPGLRGGGLSRGGRSASEGSAIHQHRTRHCPDSFLTNPLGGTVTVFRESLWDIQSASSRLARKKPPVHRVGKTQKLQS